jgi:hypothetical protein
LNSREKIKIHTSAEILWNLSGNRSDFPTIFFFWKPRIKGTLCLETLKSTTSGKCWEIFALMYFRGNLVRNLEKHLVGKMLGNISRYFRTIPDTLQTLPDTSRRNCPTIANCSRQKWARNFFKKMGILEQKWARKI